MSHAEEVIARFRGAYAMARAEPEPEVTRLGNSSYYSVNGRGTFTLGLLAQKAAELEAQIENIEDWEARHSRQAQLQEEDLPTYDPELVRLILETMPSDMARRWTALESACKGMGTALIERLGEGGVSMLLSMASMLAIEYERIGEDDPSAFIENVKNDELRILIGIKDKTEPR